MNQFTPQEPNAFNEERATDFAKNKRIKAYIALSLVIAIFAVSLIVALCRTPSEAEISSLPESEAVTDAFAESSLFLSEQESESVIESSSEPEEYFPVINVTTPEGVAAAAIYESDSLHCIYSEYATEQRSIASITKLVTAAVALKYIPLDTLITVGSELSLVKPDSSVCGLRRGYRLTLEQLLYGLLMSSGNDAAYTIAVSVAREEAKNPEMSDATAVQYFCTLMNTFAIEIGATHSSFSNPEGWDDENNYSTVSDLAVIAKYASEQPVIAEISSTVRFNEAIASGEQMSFFNSNLLLHSDSRFYCPYATGLKTGSTSGAGKCLVTTVNIDGHEYIAIVLGCPDEETRYTSMNTLISYIEEYDSLKFS